MTSPPDQAARVLLVDDNAGVAAALRVMARLDGRFTVDTVARTAQEGLDAFDDHDAVILDLHLPDGEGAELIKRYVSALPDVPIIAHTAAGVDASLGDAAHMISALVSKGRASDLTDALAAATGR